MLSLNEKLAYFLRYSTVISIWSTIALEQDHNVKLHYVFLSQVLIHKTLVKRPKYRLPVSPSSGNEDWIWHGKLSVLYG